MARTKQPNNETNLVKVAKAALVVLTAIWNNTLVRSAVVAILAWTGMAIFGYAGLFESVSANTAEIAVIEQYIEEDRELKGKLQGQYETIINLLPSLK